MPYSYCDASFVTSTQLDRPTLFKSEFGQESLPAFETLGPALNGSLGDFNLDSAVMEHRKHAGPKLAAPITSLFGGATDQNKIHLTCPPGQVVDIVAEVGDVGSCSCEHFCASDWYKHLKVARPHWTGATTAVPGSTTDCQCVQATHWCPLPPKYPSGCDTSCDKVGNPKPANFCVPNKGPSSGVLGRSTAAALKGTSEADFRRVIYLSQLSQTLCIKSYLEELRRGKHTMGALIWQLNDVWQASSWGSLDYGGRWRSLHHNLQSIFAPTVVSVWVDNSTAALHVYASHHGAAGTSKNQVEVNVTSIATGAVLSSKLVPGIRASDGSAAIRPLLSLPLDGIHRETEFLTTRLIADPPTPEDVTVVMHPLLPPVEVAWATAAQADVTLHVEHVSNTAAVVSVVNAAPTPLFYTVLTTTFDGRFDDNLIYMPPHSTRIVRFSFTDADGRPTQQQFHESMTVDWLNRAV